MRVLGRLIAGVLAASILCPQAASAQTWTDFRVGGVTRRALVYVPNGIDNPPLLISLHGRGIGAGWHQGGMMKFEPIADREKFIVVYPDALMDLNWDLGGTTDIDFVRQIIEDMSQRYGIDRSRVYASGFSMGGMFSYTLACKVPDLIAAIAPGNGYPLGPFGRIGCVDTRPVPIFHMHGTADDFVAYSGIHNYLRSWVTAYGCPATPVETRPYPQSNPGSQSFKEHWGPCMNASGQRGEVVLVSVTGMIHDWATAGKANANEDPAFAGRPFDIDGSEEAWAFLKNHSLESTNPINMMGAGGTGTAGMDTAGMGAAGMGIAGTGTAGMDTAGVGAAGMGAAGIGTAGIAAAGLGGVTGETGGIGGTSPGTAGSTPSTDAAGQAAPASSSGGSSCRMLPAAKQSGSGQSGSAPLALVLGLGLALRLRATRRRG